MPQMSSLLQMLNIPDDTNVTNGKIETVDTIAQFT